MVVQNVNQHKILNDFCFLCFFCNKTKSYPIEGYVGVCDSIPTMNNLISSETNSLRIHPSTDRFIFNINAAQIIKDKSDQITSNGVVHFVDEV